MPAYSAIIQDDDIDALDQRVQREARRQEAANNGGVRIKKPGRRRRDANQGGQASWLSSVINLVNTSTSSAMSHSKVIHAIKYTVLMETQSSEPAS